MNKSTEATPEDANHSLARRIGDEPQKFWDKVLWTDFMDQSDGKAKVWEKKGSAHDPKHTSTSETQCTQVYIIVHITQVM